MNITQRLAKLVFPSPRSSSGERPPTGCAFAGQQSQPERGTSPQTLDSRCQFTFSDGRRCRNQHTQFCVHHSSRQEREGRGNGFPDEGLVALCGDLTTATNINRALSQVFLLMAQGRIPQKQAVAFGYLSQLLLQTVPGIRSEYVSVHGYKSWENRLKSSLTEKSAETPDSSPDDAGGGEEQEEQSSEANAQPTNGIVEPEKPVFSRESHGDQELRGPEEDTQLFGQEKVAPPAPPSPDYADIYRRSLNLLDRKYDTTPEGRAEANALLLELELMNPAPAKPRRDSFGQTADLLRRLHEHESEISAPAPPPSQSQSVPRPSAPAPLKTSLAETPAVSAAPDPAFCSSGRPAEASLSGEGGRPEAFSASPIAAASKPADGFVAPPSPEPRRASRRPESQPHPRKQKVPAPTNQTARSTAHNIDWYAPPSWSAPRPDPFPGRQEKLKRQVRDMSDRRRQHQNQSRAFWR